MSRLEDLLLVADPQEVFPATPALDVRIERTLARRRRSRWNLALIAAVGVAAVAVGALVSPSARSAFSSWLRIGGVTIERRDEPPAVDYRRRPELGERVTLAEARALVPYRLRVLPERRVGAPTAVYIRRRPRGLGMVTLVYGSLERPRLLLSQWRGARYGFLKVLPHGAPAEAVSLGFGVGYWVPRAHAFHYTGPDGAMYEERFYLSAPALVWAERVTTFRLEADVSRAEALELARSLR
jgi:hypothetical protein